MTHQVAVLGSGSFGICLAILAARAGHRTILWGRNPDTMLHLERTRSHPIHLPQVKLPDSLEVTSDLGDVLQVACLVHAIPAQQTRIFWQDLQDAITVDTKLLLATKGFEENTGLRLDEVFTDLFGEQWVARQLAVLSGPTFAAELAQQMPSAAVVASRNEAIATFWQQLFSSDKLRLYTSKDLIGVQVAGAFKNIIAIAAGISEAMQVGLNARAALITRGLAEMIRFGVAQGADPATFSGLAGLGDLVLTTTGHLSRNRQLGYRIGLGESPSDILGSAKEVTEGVATTASVYRRAQEMGESLPITEQVFQILFYGKDPKRAALEFMQRTLRPE
ncbi:glycerol-3-phosphate dehydrogenase [NAD(P)+]-like [Ylistrum balloti]|uniref:glycerol-3-phosphate dehydrogenase [NAD(P)+]-like n=1 Tax=Ylistrum balloti TaxID=509963 RepID=UPI0029059425|nr:glycerol-3-phosphate dehydrogenase [NAD(P)+]-like [Ylistrum balloti]